MLVFIYYLLVFIVFIYYLLVFIIIYYIYISIIINISSIINKKFLLWKLDLPRHLFYWI